MNWNEYAVSLGGITVGLGILIGVFVRWWHSPGRAWKSLAFPFVPLALYGNLLILSAGGMLGRLAGFALWGSNSVGTQVLEKGTGGDSPDVTRHVNLVLTDPGHMVVVLATVAVVATWVFNKRSAKASVWRWDIVLPVLCGISLGLSAGVAGATAQILGPGVDTLGASLAGVL